MSLPPFPGFRTQAFDFLRDLAQNNEREWFKPRKSTYDDEVVWPMQCLVEDCARQAAERGLPVTGDPKQAIFRIYRDTRFSKDKRPYKTHAGAVLSRSGGKSDGMGSVYIHLEPGQCFLASGFWHPESPFLNRWRARMAQDPDGFMEIVHSLDRSGLRFSTEDSLKRLPRGYEDWAGQPIAEYLRLKTFSVSRLVPDAEMQSPGFTEAVLRMTQDSLPLLDFGWDVVDEPRRV